MCQESNFGLDRHHLCIWYLVLLYSMSMLCISRLVHAGFAVFELPWDDPTVSLSTSSLMTVRCVLGFKFQTFHRLYNCKSRYPGTRAKELLSTACWASLPILLYLGVKTHCSSAMPITSSTLGGVETSQIWLYISRLCRRGVPCRSWEPSYPGCVHVCLSNPIN